MKFVTVMDMWLLIMNMALLVGIAYGGRRLIKTVEQIANKDSDAVLRERKSILKIIQKEIDHYELVINMGNADQNLIDIHEILLELRTEIAKRDQK
jgi:hypothetical protein